MKKFLLLSIILSFAFVYSQPTIEWQKTMGGTKSEGATSIQQTTDGGYVLAGYTMSDDGDATNNQGGGGDFWVVKISSVGIIEWQKTLGGTKSEFATSIQQTTDGGYIVAGNTLSNDGDVTGNHGESDIWVVKLSSSGLLEWQKTMGGTLGDYANSIQQTEDGGYIVAGTTLLINGGITGNHGYFDALVIKLSSSGIVEWQEIMGGTGEDVAHSIQQTNDGGYIIAGEIRLNDDLMYSDNSSDLWVAKISSVGKIEWQKTLGGTNYDWANSIQQTTDGGYVVAGVTSSNDGDVTGNHGNSDSWVVKLNSSGTIVWQKTLGGTGTESASSIQQTTDGGYIVAGATNSNDGDVTGNHGAFDYWVVKLNDSGIMEWQKTLGGSTNEEPSSVRQTTDGGYIVAGYTVSNNGDVTAYQGGQDIWVVKLSNTLGINDVNADVMLSIYPNPFSNEINVKIDANILGSLYTIYDQSGRTVLTGQLNTESSIIEISDLSKGIYVFRVGDKYKSIKIVKD